MNWPFNYASVCAPCGVLVAAQGWFPPVHIVPVIGSAPPPPLATPVGIHQFQKMDGWIFAESLHTVNSHTDLDMF